MFSTSRITLLVAVLASTFANAHPAGGLVKRDGGAVHKIDKITCLESGNPVPTALCSKDPSQTVKAPIMADCLKLADRWIQLGTTAAVQSNLWGTYLYDAIGKCKPTITNGNDALAAGGLVTAQYDAKAIGQWIKDQSQACFDKAEFNMAKCSMLAPIGQLKLWSGDA